MRAAFIFLALGFLSFFSATELGFAAKVAARDCESSFSRLTQRAHLEKLVSFGYEGAVAERILLNEPDIAAKILKHPRLGAPILLYRGMKVEFKKYDPKFIPPGAYNGQINDSSVNKDIGGGVIWVSANKLAAERYAKTPAGEFDSMVIQFQVPKFMFIDTYAYQRPRGILVRKSNAPNVVTFRDDSTFIRTFVLAQEKDNKPRPVGTGFSKYFFVSPKNVLNALKERDPSNRKLFEPREIIENDRDPNWGTFVFK